MHEYQHSLFFEASDLTDREKEKIRRHFQKRRDSGGGDCAMIEKVGNNIYRVSFKEKQDQERVLQRKFHAVPLPGGELCLTVSRTSLPQTQDQLTTSQSQTCTKPNAKHFEKIFRMDIFLLFYLQENPKAFKVLQKQLSSIGCMLEFNFDEEEVVVRWEIEKVDTKAFGAAEKWELQVDRIFTSFTENYVCHHVLEPKQVKQLLQDHSFVTDDIKVYPECGYAVVVGETEAVKEKIAILEKNMPIQKELPVVENRFKLVEDEFSREMSAHYPEIKVTRGTNIIILQGPDEKVHSGAAKLDEVIKKIKEKRVQLHPSLLTFMSINGITSKYETRFLQSLRSPVTLEVGSDLVLSSLSSNALDEAEAAVLRDLSVARVKLQGAAAVPPELTRVQEILNEARSQVNRGEVRVEVSFIPASSGTPVIDVQLVGHTGFVNKLKEFLHDYQINRVLTQKVLNLQLPELVDNFDKILKMIGMKQTDVTLKTSHFPNPCVLVSGPRRRVNETLQALQSTLASLTSDTLVLDGPGALRYFKGDGKVSKELVETSCQVLIWEQEGVQTKPRSISSPNSLSSFIPRPSATRSRFNTVGGSGDNKINLEIKICSLEEVQVNVLVAPMLNKKLASTNVGISLFKKGGNTVLSSFNSRAAGCALVPGDVLQVDASGSLSCSKISFIECSVWDGVTGRSVQALGNGLKKCLDLCVQQGFSSVAIPIIGPGVVLQYPPSEAIQVLTETIHQFGLSAGSTSLSTIHVVIKPGYPDSETCYHEVYKRLRSNMNQRGQAFFSSLTSDLDDVNMTVGGGANLQVVFGDITNETTDAVVNTTDFINFDYEGVCKDILTVAGAEVEAELKAAKWNRGDVFVSKPGQFPCKAILHVCGEKDACVIEELVCSIIDQCKNFTSVAIPAICAGAGGLDPSVVAGAILRGIKAATSSRLYSLTTIRLVLIKINVFLAFKNEATQMFNTVVRKVSVPADLSFLNISPVGQQSGFQFLGLCREDVDKAMAKLKDLYKTQCSTHTFKYEELEGLTEDDMLALQQLVDSEGLYMQNDPTGNITVNGMKDGVNKIILMVKTSLLIKEMRVIEEDKLYTHVVWCILGQSGDWERLPKTANRNLENRDTAGGIQDAQGVLWQVDLQNMEATTRVPRQRTKLKRLENLPDFIYPLYWDSMAPGEAMKVVPLQPSSQEYQTVKEGFKRSCNKTVMKIERLQNIHLRRAYEAQKKHLTEKNIQSGGAGEKFLYHGTTQDSSDSIMKTGFNRRFAGQNATAYGEGTYFAVNASYSARPTYSKPAADGSQLMFVARVLTGVYTQGQSGMKVPPARDAQQPHNRYDSVVDKTNNPDMYIVFHDDQAYPDYLITFK
ncbi:protein mono-ADP-ribosyltransferase PARP14 isoform X2 [Kryptolebias marmoratus]|uniref:protein mono-ADP-ribosyltransferase PARP14 isoform X2 n=1 Tax=Kryptolebias marmoratus TaxID=37003 RepID=UPI0018AC9E30|nr:protein mono-ADP-ribosyltransferase PARP14 isoform X2 [Kryptolebias marmoratus]